MDRSKWISEKVSKLMAEGQSQDQALAIAFSMYNRMEEKGGNPEYQVGGQYTQFGGVNYTGYQPPVAPQQMTPFPQPPLPTFDGTSPEESLGVQPYQQTPQDYTASLNGAMMTPQGEQMRTQMSQGQIQSQEDKQFVDKTKKPPVGQIQFFNQYGGLDIPTAAGVLGSSIENKDTLGIIGSGVKLAAGLGRNIFGAMGQQRRENQVMQDYYEKQREDLTRTEVMKNGGYFQEGGAIPSRNNLSNSQVNQLTNEGLFGGMNIDKEFAESDFFTTDEAADARIAAVLAKEKSQVYDPRTSPFADITKTDRRVTPEGDLQIGENYRVWKQRPEWFVGKKDADGNNLIPTVNKEYVDYNPQQYKDFQNTDAYRKYKGIPTGLASYQDGGQQGGGQDQMMQQVAQALQQGTDPNQVIEQLIKTGVPHDQAMQMVQSIMEQVQGGQEATQEQAFMQKGGKIGIEKILTGEFMTGMDKENPMKEPNAEIEAGEHVKNPNGEIQEVIGDTHEKGGEDVVLEEGTKILSDHLKISAKNAKDLRDKYDLQLKAADTYATVLDKFNKKSGLTKIVNEQEELIKKLDKETKENKDDEALGLNTQHLTNKINELEKEKKVLEDSRKGVFEDLFKRQEDSKPKKEQDSTGEFFQDGGQIKALAEKYGISLDVAQNLIKDLPMYQDGGFSVRNKYADPSQYINQDEVGTGYYGDVVTKNPQEVLAENARLHPELYAQFFTGKQILPKDVVGFQKAVNAKYENILGDAKSLYGADSPEYKRIEQDINQNKFLDDKSVRGTEGKFGNYTSTRPNYVLNVLPKEELEKIRKDGIDNITTTQLKTKYPEMYKKYVEPKNLKSDAFLGAVDKADPVDVADSQKLFETTKEIQGESANRMNFLMLPDQTPMLPGSLEPHLKIHRRFDRVNPALLSPEQAINETNRNQMAITEQLNNVPGAQRAAALVGLGANTQANINKVVTDTNKINSQIITQADARNASIQMSEENAAASDALSYEQRQLRAKALTDNDINNYYNTVRENNVRNWNKVNDINMVNAMHEDFQFTGNGIEKTSPNIVFGVDGFTPPLTPEQRIKQLQDEAKAIKKANKQNGGRFK